MDLKQQVEYMRLARIVSKVSFVFILISSSSVEIHVQGNGPQLSGALGYCSLLSLISVFRPILLTIFKNFLWSWFGSS